MATGPAAVQRPTSSPVSTSAATISVPPWTAKTTERSCPTDARRGATARALVGCSRTRSSMARFGSMATMPAGDQVLGQHRVRPLVDVAVPAVAPGAQELGGRPRVIDLVEVVAARHLEPPEPEDEGEDDERQCDERVAPAQAPHRLPQVRVGRIRRQPAHDRGSRARTRVGRVAAAARREPTGGARDERLAGMRPAPGLPGHDAQQHRRQRADEPGAGIGEDRRLEDRVLDHRLPVGAGVDDPGQRERPVVRVRPVDVREEDDRQAAVDPRPGAPGEQERGGEGERREQVALVDPGGEHEEGDGQDERGEEDAAHVVAPRDAVERHDRDDREEQRARRAAR